MEHGVVEEAGVGDQVHAAHRRDAHGVQPLQPHRLECGREFRLHQVEVAGLVRHQQVRLGAVQAVAGSILGRHGLLEGFLFRRIFCGVFHVNLRHHRSSQPILVGPWSFEVAVVFDCAGNRNMGRG